MKYFPPEQRIMVNVKMTKCLYAMANHCRYTGDPRTGWNIPPITYSKYNAHVLGIKIACGLEMLIACANEERRKKEKRSLNDSEKLKTNEDILNTYLSRLEVNGYFRNLLKDSEEYVKLLNAAKDYYFKYFNLCNSVTDINKSDTEKILEAWENIQSNDIELHGNFFKINIVLITRQHLIIILCYASYIAQDEAALSPADSDSWLNVDPVQLEIFLNEKWGNVKSKKHEQESLSLKEKVQMFLNQNSDIDGVQFLEYVISVTILMIISQKT